MRLSMQIFAYGLREFCPQAEICSNAFEIEAVRLFSANVKMEKNTLYIGRLSDLFKNGNERVICAHRNDLLLLDTTDLEEVLNRVLDVLSFYTAWDTAMMNLVTTGAMLQDLFDASEEVLRRPVFLLDPLQRHLAHTQNYGIGEVDEMWDTLLTSGSCDMEFLLSFNEADPERITRKGIYSYEEPYFPNESYHYNFIIRDSFLGSATFIVLDHGMQEGELDVFSLFCMYLERWFRLHIQEQDNVILDAQIRAAVSDEKADASELRRRLLLLGWQEEDPLIFLKLDAPLQPYSINTHLAHSLNMAFPHLYAVTLDLSVCLLCNLRIDSLEETKRQLEPWLSSAKYYAAMGQIFYLGDSFFDNYKFAEVTSLHCEKKVGKIYEGKDYVLSYLLEQMQSTILPDALHPALKVLHSYDAKHHTEFYETLRVYLKKERNIAETARTLLLHRNTLLYRLKRLGELVSDDLDNDMVRLHLLLSFEIAQIREERKSDPAGC